MPKGVLLLEVIDENIESLYGHKWKSLLDAYKGCHQIHMHRGDEEKTSFHMDMGTFCYTKMAFELKNVGAAYERLADKVFEPHIDWNIKVYVDDIAIKIEMMIFSWKTSGKLYKFENHQHETKSPKIHL